eukprot:TRINITY_DN100830_c0_g1_i1.p1 TRINITY_DN100830_c0_g1~~TRINITY_DN100830_c0_g1_i1.p1  ORF type:complete len:307 (+),score=63.19 TRINITY_DN100830_c0_g1_i1:102-1022(+)
MAVPFSGPASPSRMPSGRSLFAKSSPAIAASFNLRDLRMDKRTLGMERVLSAPTQFPLENVKERERRKRLAALQEAQRQKEEDERGLEAKAKLEAARQMVAEREQAKEERQRAFEERQKIQLTAWKKEKEDREQRIFQRQEAERVEREEKERIEYEEAEADRIRKLPEVCPACEGGGRCPSCSGEQVHKALFLTSRVTTKSDVLGYEMYEFGQKPRGCTDCEGYNQGITGRPLNGTGICAMCFGAGKFCTGFCHFQRKKKKLPTSAHLERVLSIQSVGGRGDAGKEADGEFCSKCGGRRANVTRCG